ncbi:hypothetical protein VOLCADRAFT_94959 [Volvox carteri f. nagariensis]|uniref:Uncharacterized protein n=1 Tax=Volvox carteri f. nagariensis TaxID=3068 RepID=D8U683_VOLCA|nr:uncharacterized protein VOLCADRAFT_94959 [Volvox carteri f. nagariensis]EFJ44896.1 hypothetical protein VOLCADRAFT_94959 [Volvox carteri f. nagariensis]|eukprot:XP_002954179.1 hypothetical protein VOLCADRAFT_94959 [Volvox carteri f. nagariensis]
MDVIKYSIFRVSAGSGRFRQVSQKGPKNGNYFGIGKLSADGKITAATVQAAAAPNGGIQQLELVEFTDAFSVPHLAFDPVQRKLFLNTKPRHIHASAESKHQLYLQRLLLIQQRLQRSRMFQQSNLLLPNSSSRGHSVQLTDLQSLMGVFGVTRYVLGCISRAEDGRYVLEDTTGAVPLDLSAAETAAGFYTGFSGVLTVPSVFVLMGNFHSRAGGGGCNGRHGLGGGGGGSDAMSGGSDVDYGTMRELFGQLASLIDQYPRLKV